MPITYAAGVITVTGAKDSGTSTGFSATTLTDTSKAWTVNQWANYPIWITSGTYSGAFGTVTSNTSTILTLTDGFWMWNHTTKVFDNVIPSATDTYSLAFIDEDMYQDDVAGGWGVVTKSPNALSPSYQVDARIVLASGGFFGLSPLGSFSLYGGSGTSFSTVLPAIWVPSGNRFHQGTMINGIGCQGGTLKVDNPALHSGADFRRLFSSPFNTDSTVGDIIVMGGAIDTNCVINMYDATLGSGSSSTSLVFIETKLTNKFAPLVRGSTVQSVIRDSGTTGSLESFSLLLLVAGGSSNMDIIGLFGLNVDIAFYAFGGNPFSVVDPFVKHLDYIARIESNNNDLSIIDANPDSDFDIPVYWNTTGYNTPVDYYTSWFPYTRFSGVYETGVNYRVENNVGTEVANASTASTPAEIEYLWQKYTWLSGLRPGTSTIAAYNDFSVVVRKYGKVFQSFTRPLTRIIKYVDDAGAVLKGESISIFTNIYTVATEAAAAALTGVAITGSSKTIVLSSARTVQELYDYSQYWGQLSTNLQYTESITTVDGSNFTLSSGWSLTTEGNLTFGAMRIVGGTLIYNSVGTYSPNISGSTIDFTAAAGTYDLRNGDFTGAITITNSGGGSITVQMPVGVTVVNTGPNITLEQTASVNIVLTNLTIGTRVQLYNVDDTTELYNGVPGTSLTHAVIYTADKQIRIRIAYQSTVNAMIFIETTQTLTSAGLAYGAEQVADSVYESNAIDGSTVTGITITPAPTDRVKINISGGTVSWAQIYAYQVYWLQTATGISDEAAFITASDQANYLLTGFDIRNDSATALTIIGGWGRDSATLTIADIIDVAGSTGNIYPQPDHVVNNIVTIGGSNIITGDIADILTPLALKMPTSHLAATAGKLNGVALVDTTTTNTDMRGTDGANTTAPDNASITAIKSKTDPLTFTKTGEVDSNIKSVNDVTVTGTGSDGDTWGP